MDFSVLQSKLSVTKDIITKAQELSRLLANRTGLWKQVNNVVCYIEYIIIIIKHYYSYKFIHNWIILYYSIFLSV
jgi:hypothetical protein